jgi:hypothetical protein
LTVNVDLTSSSISVVGMTVLPNYLGGLTLSNDTTSPNTVLDIGTGGAAADDNSIMLMQSVPSFTKNCNAAWAVGSGLGALDSGTTLAVNTWYHVFLIMRLDTNVVDVLISTNATAPILPTNYTKKRRIGSIRTNPSSPQISGFTQVGDEFIWADPTLGGNVWTISNAGFAATPGSLFALYVPSGIKTVAVVNVALSGVSATMSVSICSPDQMANQGPIWNLYYSTGVGGQFRVRTNTNSQILVAGGTASSAGLYMAALGWVDNRGK